MAQDARWLAIKAKGGLGNRMLAGVTGLVWADLAGRRAVIDWRDGAYAPEGVDAYPLIFEAPAGSGPDALPATDDVTPALWAGRLDAPVGALIAERGRAEHSSPFAWRRYSVDLSRIDQPETVAVFWSYLPKFRALARPMRADPRFAGRPRAAVIGDCLARWFRPRAGVRAAAAAALAPLPRPLIGVHVRHTDRKAPLDRIEALLLDELARSPGAGVFLATDSAAVEDRLRARVPHLATIAKWFPPEGARIHNNAAAPDMVREAENALIDMHALAGCDRLIHSSHSTFSVAACLIGGLGRDRQIDVDRWNPLVQAKRLIQEFT